MTPAYSTSVLIDADPDDVFECLIDPERLVAWMGDRALLKPETGGQYEVDINGVLIRGRFIEIERPHRLVISWGQLGNGALPPESSRVTFTLTAVDQGTRLELRHDNLPEGEHAKHARGWPHFLERLRVVGAGRDPGPDPWAVKPDASQLPLLS